MRKIGNGSQGERKGILYFLIKKIIKIGSSQVIDYSFCSNACWRKRERLVRIEIEVRLQIV